MRRPTLKEGTYHHIILRGARGMNIMHDDADRWDCLKRLYYQNDSFIKRQWERDLEREECKLFERPSNWPARDPLCSILAFCIHDNHIHLLVKEICEGGISKFMHRFPNSMSHHYNRRYGGSGTIFQGSYKNRFVSDTSDIINLTLYILIKNVFERYDGGFESAIANWNIAWQWAASDPFSAFADYAGFRDSPIIHKDVLEETFPSPDIFHKEAKQYMKHRVEREEMIKGLIIEDEK